MQDVALQGASALPPSPHAALTPARARMLLGLLTVALVFNFIDRQIITILADPISKELDLSDTQIGLMTGLSFAIFYTVMGIPLARLTDNPRVNRSKLLAVCVALWSGMTAIGGLAQNFVQLLAARVGVAIGEAGCMPAATSLIADIAPPEKRASAMSVFSLGIPIGVLMGLVIGGLVAEALGWRAALAVVGLPGMGLAATIWLVGKDPRRSDMKHLAAAGDLPPAIGMGAALREIMATPTFRWIVVSGTIAAFVNYGKGVWQILYLVRTHDLSVGHIGLWLGLLTGVLGIVGTMLGGWLGDRYGARNPQFYLSLAIFGSIVGVPVSVIAYTTHNPWVAIALLAGHTMLMTISNGPTYAVLHSVVRPLCRGFAVSIKQFAQMAIGLGLGPLIFGMLSDALQQRLGEDSVQWILLAATPLMLVTAFADWRARKHIRNDYLG